MHIRAQVASDAGGYAVTVRTNDREQALAVPAKDDGRGSRVNGGEFLFLALATCFCNDLYREAAKQRIAVRRVEVEVEGDFGAEGEPCRAVSYAVRVAADADEERIRKLVRATDRLTEIQNTVRAGAPVELSAVQVERV